MVPTSSAAARDALASALDDAASKELSRTGQSYKAWLLRHDRFMREAPASHEQANGAQLADQIVPVDGTPVNATIERDESGLWTAMAMIADVVITVEGGDFDPAALRLVAIAGPSAYFDR